MGKKRTLNTFKNKFICGGCETVTPYIGEVTGELNQVVAQLTQNIEEVKNAA